MPQGENTICSNGVLLRVTDFCQRALSVSRFGTHVAMTMATNLLLGLVTIVTGALVARLLQPEGRGELAAIQSWSAFIATIALLGLPEAVVYFSGRDPERAKGYWVSATSLALICGLPFLLLGYWLMPWLLSAQSSTVVSIARWYLLGLIPIFAFHWMPLGALRGRGDFAVWNILQFLPSLGWFCILILSWILAYTTPSFVALGYLAMMGLLFFLVACIASRRIPGPFSLDTRSWGAMLRYALPLGVATVPQQLLSYGRLAQLFMAALLDPRSLGLFAVALAWGNMTGPLTHAVGVVLFPDIASRSTEAEKGTALARGLRLSMLLTGSLSLILVLLTPYGVPALFGEDFAPAVPAAMVMVVAGGIMGIKMILDQGLRGWGKSEAVLIGELIGLASTMLLLPSILFRYNVIGAAISSLVGYAATTVYLVLQARRLTNQSIQRLLWPSLAEIVTFLQRFRTIHSLERGDRYDLPPEN